MSDCGLALADSPARSVPARSTGMGDSLDPKCALAGLSGGGHRHPGQPRLPRSLGTMATQIRHGATGFQKTMSIIQGSH